ncbi:MAG: class I SAM-dependent methyltransferase [Ferruginibacter sp.]
MSETNAHLKRQQYYFDQIVSCDMCGSPTSGHKVLGQRLNHSQGLNPKSSSGISVSVMKCTNCNLIYSNPQPIPYNIQDHYGIPPEEYWNKTIYDWEEDYFSEQIAKTKELLNFVPGMKALDCGAGLGKGMLSLQHAGFDTYGFEPSVPFYERAITKMNIDSNRLQLGMLEDVDYEDNSFDFVNFGAVLEHFYHPSDSIKKAMKWLKPGGVLHIEVPSSKHLIAKLLNAYYTLRGTNYVTHLSPMHSPFHLYEFDLRSFTENSKRFDQFTIAFHKYDVGTIFHGPRIIQPVLKKYMEMTNKGLQLVVWLRKK